MVLRLRDDGDRYVQNEPHGEATWGHGSLRTDFHAFAERAIKRLAASVPGYTGLWFVEGTEENDWTDKYPHWWGGNLDGVKKRPVRTGDAAIDRRVVLSPHIYGPEVRLLEALPQQPQTTECAHTSPLPPLYALFCYTGLRAFLCESRGDAAWVCASPGIISQP
jgi:hypothetical protein